MHAHRAPIGDATADGFAVVDVETTGFSPTRDRIVEIAVVHVDRDGSIADSFCTLVDPQRDVGPTRVHGLTASTVRGAPTFSDAAPTVWNWLSGRVFVAHNAPFDLRFLDAELGRCGLRLPPPPTMCTMRLAGSYLSGLPSRTLDACCEAAGVTLSHHHSALDDALASAQLLARYLSIHGSLPPSWSRELADAARARWERVAPDVTFHPVTRSDQAERAALERAPLARVVHRLPRGPDSRAEGYMGVLDRVLEDRVVTSDELDQLYEVATMLGLTQEAASRAHRAYLSAVAAAAWLDGTVTAGERADLLAVARLLDVPDGEALSILDGARDGATSATLDPARLGHGDRVVLTGETRQSRDELTELATGAGLRVTGSVSSKTALLVASDPHSQSGKARRARELGVRVVTEQVFLYLLAALGGLERPGAVPRNG